MSGDAIHVTYEDQLKINRFARLHAKTVELRDELTTLDKDLTNLNTSLEEIDTLTLMDDDGDNATIHIMEGDVFVKFTADNGKEWINKRKQYLDSEKKRVDSNLEELKTEMCDIKAALYSKFGVNTINLEADDDE